MTWLSEPEHERDRGSDHDKTQDTRIGEDIADRRQESVTVEVRNRQSACRDRLACSGRDGHDKADDRSASAESQREIFLTIILVCSVTFIRPLFFLDNFFIFFKDFLNVLEPNINESEKKV